MNISKFTQKSIQAVQDLEKIAYEYGNQEVEQEHLLYALLSQEDSLILKLIEKMEINKEYFVNTVKKALDARVKVSGGDLRFGQYLNKSLVSAEDEARAMGDEYVSVEHLFLSLLKQPSPSMKKIFDEFGITRERFLQALSTVRGNQRVVSDNPEATYDTLNKYGEDLVEKARNQKLDPVIGRDAEIRNIVRILSRKTKNNPALLMREPTATEHTHTKRVRTSSGMMSVLFLLSLQSSSKFLFPEIHPVLQGMIMPVSAGSL